MSNLTYVDYLWIGNVSFFIYCTIDSLFQLRERLKENINKLTDPELVKHTVLLTYSLYLMLIYGLYYITFELINQHVAFGLLFFETIFRVIRNQHTTKPLVEENEDRKE